MNPDMVYYRGPLRICNYDCSYCPFRAGHLRKNTNISDHLAEDEAALKRFCEKMLAVGNNRRILLIPQGEALIHDYYHGYIKQLADSAIIKSIGCQTNLSFNIERFARRLAGVTDKVSLWCTFHPAQIAVTDFLRQCERLKAWGIKFCVGAVGHPDYLPVLQSLRDKLPSDIYLWINGIKGRNRSYTAAEIRAFTALDPLFELEINALPADCRLCHGGRESIFVDGGGDIYACKISKVRLGNLYQAHTRSRAEISRPLPQICQARSCNCYLAYANRTELQALVLSKEAIFYRRPHMGKAIFFDIDGTLTDQTGTIPPENIAAVRKLAEAQMIFLATSLPYEYARKTCADIWDYVAGGAFAEGADLRIFAKGYAKIIPLAEAARAIVPKDCGYICYREKGVLYKIAVTNGTVLPCEEFTVICDEVTGIVAKKAGKLNGIRDLCAELGLLAAAVTVVGNGENDVLMLQHFEHSIAVPAAVPAAQNAARRICRIAEIMRFDRLSRIAGVTAVPPV